MKLHIASMVIAIVISTAAHSSPQTPAGIASNIFPNASHYGGIPAPEGPLATILPELKKQARAGDERAAVTSQISTAEAMRIDAEAGVFLNSRCRQENAHEKGSSSY